MKKTLLFFAFILIGFLANSQTSNPKTAYENKSNGQQNNNTSSGTQKVYNNQKTTNNKTSINNRTVTYNAPITVLKDSSKLIKNYYGDTAQRSVTNDDIDLIKKMVVNKKTRLFVMACQTKECIKYAQDIKDKLKDLGYSNVYPEIGTNLNSPSYATDKRRFFFSTYFDEDYPKDPCLAIIVNLNME